MYKYQINRDGKTISIYDFIVRLYTVDGARTVKVEAESYAEAEEYARNYVSNVEPWLAASGKIAVISTYRIQPA